MLGKNKKSYRLKQTCTLQLEGCLSMYYLLLPRSMKGLRYLQVQSFYCCIQNNLLVYCCCRYLLEKYDTLIAYSKGNFNSSCLSSCTDKIFKFEETVSLTRITSLAMEEQWIFFHKCKKINVAVNKILCIFARLKNWKNMVGYFPNVQKGQRKKPT